MTPDGSGQGGGGRDSGRTGTFAIPRATGEYPGVPVDGGARRGRQQALRLYGVVSLDTHAEGNGHGDTNHAAAAHRATPPTPAPRVDSTAETVDAPMRRDVHAVPAPPIVEDTELLAYRDVGAIVAPAVYAASPLTPQELDRYREVIDGAFSRRPVVPAPPGTVFRSRELLAGWLELHYYTLVEALSFLEDRVTARLSVMRAEPSAPPSLRLAPADTAEMAVVGDLTSLAAESFRALRAEAVALLILRAGPDAAAPDAAAHGSFLIERRRWRDFEQAVGVEAARHPTLRFQCTGPWPPYDFVRMQFTS